MLISTPSVYESQPTEWWQENLKSLFDRPLSLFIPYLLALNSSLPSAVSGVLLFLPRALPYELCYSLMTFYTFMGLIEAWDQGQGLEITSVPAPPSPGFELAVGDFVLMPLLHAEDDPSLGCCLMAVVDKTFGLGFPSVYPCFFLWNGLIWTCVTSLLPGWMYLGLCYKYNLQTELVAGRRWMWGGESKAVWWS